MNTPKFSIDEAIQSGWDVAKRHVGFFFIVFIISMVANAIPSGVQTATQKTAPFLSFLFGVVGLVVGQVVTIGLTKISLKSADGQKAEIADLFNGYPLFFKFLFATILYTLIVIIGLVLLIVPGIYLAVRYSQYGFLVVDRGLGPVESLRQSSALTEGARWQLFLFGILLFGIVLVGALVLLIGLFWAVPTVLVASAFVYRRLLAATEGPAAGDASAAPAAPTAGV